MKNFEAMHFMLGQALGENYTTPSKWSRVQRDSLINNGIEFTSKLMRCSKSNYNTNLVSQKDFYEISSPDKSIYEVEEVYVEGEKYKKSKEQEFDNISSAEKKWTYDNKTNRIYLYPKPNKDVVNGIKTVFSFIPKKMQLNNEVPEIPDEYRYLAILVAACNGASMKGMFEKYLILRNALYKEVEFLLKVENKTGD